MNLTKVGSPWRLAAWLGHGGCRGVVPPARAQGREGSREKQEEGCVGRFNDCE